MRGFFLLLLVIPFLLSGFAQDAARQGYDAYQQGDYADAERLFRQALEQEPENPRLIYNLGSTLAQRGEHEEAGELLERFKELAEEPTEKAQAEYNLGNVYSNQEDWENAMRHYRNSLKIVPEDEDARFNYELAYRNHQQEQQQQPPDQQPDQTPDSPEGADAPPPETDEQDGDQMPSELPQPGEQQDISERLREMSEMTPEEADEMLNALDNIEQHLLRDYKERQLETVEQDEKDW